MLRSALTLLMLAAPAVALADSPIKGHTDFYAGGANLNGITVWASGGVARANLNLDQRWNVEGEAFADSIFNNDGSLVALGGALHAYWRDPERFSAGAFVTANGLWGNGNHFANHYRAGPEAQFYAGNVTLYGQAWFGQELTTGNPTPLNEVGGRAMVRWFANDNLRLDTELAYVSVFGGSIRASGLIGAVQANYRFADTPWTVFGRYQIDHPMDDAAFVGNLHRFNVGLRFNFGSSTLKDDDRNGATMEAPTRILHFFARP